ncbi:tetratricopeptide repeat protein [Chitinophaga skermanii]|uniref:Tetratricopeptide repeat protein n=1 Tax=Chitinophaga skermanii TaxID=331697 RepID=A0A327Q864_9BACT|nr:tetratricopeptide repeat protein [Chitinophaga skermanii]RAI99891.1 tetratricopeptide repeat protein [Chitinophaga skermanii]
MRFVLFLLLVCVFPASALFAQQKTYDFNPRCQEAYDAIMQLRLGTGKALLEAEKRENPNNLIPYFLDNYCDFFPLFFNEDPAEYNSKKQLRAERISKMQEGPSESPYYLYTQAAIKFQWALVRVKFGEKWDATWEIRRAYQQFKDNNRKFPSFLPNTMMIGTMQTVFGTIPEGYKWITNILGLKGSIKTGMQNMNNFVNSQAPTAVIFKEESYYYYCYLKLFIENKPEELWQFIQQRQLDTKHNYLFALMVANLSMNNQKAAQGLEVLANRVPSNEYTDLYYQYYLAGVMRLDHLDDSAVVYFDKFLRNFKGKFYVKEALQRMSWAYYIKGNQDMANKYRQMILNRGNTETDADKQALKDAKSGKWPNVTLLKARLLSDGGYFNEALQLLQTKKAADFSTISEQLEYAYRLGRIYDDIGNDDQAIRMYQVTMRLGANRPEYFAARSALQMGYIYEKRKDKDKAIECFNACLDMEGHDYKNSLDQRAKAGLLRVNGG